MSAQPPGAFFYKIKPAYAGAILALALFVLYAATAPRVLWFEDSARFVLACAGGDIAHAPGYPLYALLCRPFAAVVGWVPGVSPPFAAALFSAFCAACACVLLARVVCFLGAPAANAIACAALFGVSLNFWGQANIPEVYTLNALLFFAALALLLQWRQNPQTRPWLALVFVCALALANHWPLFGLAAFAFPILLWRQRGWLWARAKSPAFWGQNAAVLALGMLPFAYLAWRSNNPLAFMGLPYAIDSWGVFAQAVSREWLQHIDEQSGADWNDKLDFAVFVFGNAFFNVITPVGGSLALLGFARSWRAAGAGVALFLLCVFLGATAGLLLVLNFIYDQKNAQIFSSYPLLPHAVLCVWCAFALRGRVGLAALALAAALTLATHFAANNKTEQTLMDDVAGLYLQTLPQNAGFFASDIIDLPLASRHHLQKERPDLLLPPVPSPHVLEILRPGGELYAANTLPFEEEMRLVNNYVNSAAALCYNTFVPFADPRPSREYLLFSCLRGDDEPPTKTDERVERFFIELASRHADIRHWQERQLADALIHNAVYSMAFLRARGQLPPQWEGLLERLRATPPGLLARLEYLAAQPHLVVSFRRVSELQEEAAKAIPLMQSARRRARLLSALAQMYAAVRPPTAESKEFALLYHRAAVRLLPALANPATRRAHAYFMREGMKGEAAELLARFGPQVARQETARWE